MFTRSTNTFQVLLNWVNAIQSITFDLSDVGLVSADFTDLWTGADLGNANMLYTALVDAHGALVYKLSNGVQAVPCQYTTYLATTPPNLLKGGATPRALNNSASVVSNIGHGGTLTFVGVDGGTRGGTKLLSFSYSNADYTFYNTDCSNCRRAEVSVNRGTPVVVEMPISGQVRVVTEFGLIFLLNSLMQSWDILFEGYFLSLDGFVPGPHNIVTFANPSAWAPDMYSIGVRV